MHLTVVDQNPLGSAAGYGSSFPIDRTFTTKKFRNPEIQCRCANESRKIRKSCFSVAATLAKFSMDVCLYMSQNFDFITLPAHLTTGSSIMPQENPMF
jgi:argininosuccinate lyase